jgi:hypothetical protein
MPCDKDKLKLEIELIPSKVWFPSIYQILKNSNKLDEWRGIKRAVFEREGEHCWICSKIESRLEAHEFWEYDDAKHVQKLAAIHHLCDLCHKIKHIGFWCHTPEGARRLEQQGLCKEDLIKHFCAINQCNRKDFDNYEYKVFRIWDERNKYEWEQDFGEYTPIVLKALESIKLQTSRFNNPEPD